jgi:hypothetical protein
LSHLLQAEPQIKTTVKDSDSDWIQILSGLDRESIGSVEKRQNSFERQDVLSGGLEVSPVAFKSYLEVKAVLWIRIRMC